MFSSIAEWRSIFFEREMLLPSNKLISSYQESSWTVNGFDHSPVKGQGLPKWSPIVCQGSGHMWEIS